MHKVLLWRINKIIHVKCLTQLSFPVLWKIKLLEDPPNMKHLENAEQIIMDILLKAITGFIRKWGKFPEIQNKRTKFQSGKPEQMHQLPVEVNQIW